MGDRWYLGPPGGITQTQVARPHFPPIPEIGDLDQAFPTVAGPDSGMLTLTATGDAPIWRTPGTPLPLRQAQPSAQEGFAFKLKQAKPVLWVLTRSRGAADGWQGAKACRCPPGFSSFMGRYLSMWHPETAGMGPLLPHWC